MSCLLLYFLQLFRIGGNKDIYIIINGFTQHQVWEGVVERNAANRGTIHTFNYHDACVLI